MKHYVRVCRPRFEVAVLEIEADDDEQAQDIAIREATELPRERWHLLPFNGEHYQPHVETCHSEHTIDANAADEEGVREAYVEELKSPEAGEAIEDIRYLLLFADVWSGEGRVVFEPWFRFCVDEPELIEHDLAGDWMRKLKAVGEDSP